MGMQSAGTRFSNRLGQKRARFVLTVCSLLLSAWSAVAQGAADPLPSWNDGPTKQAIVDFVTHVTKEGGSDFVAPEDRIATVDNDGTLWTEKPDYVEAIFTVDRVHQMAPQHPEWQTQQPFAAVLHHDMKALAASGDRGTMQLLLATHSNVTTDQFGQIVADWIRTAQHPRFHRLYTQCVYQPMLEVLAYLRANGFKTYIVSGGETEFMRAWEEKVYGVPREQVVGTTIKTKFEDAPGGLALQRLPQFDSIDDGPGKPENIGKFIGKRPIAAFGNSDGDQQMLEWTAAGSGRRLMVLVHHTDAQREYAYDRDSSVGRLDKALDEATAKHWVVVNMKDDWKVIFPPLP